MLNGAMQKSLVFACSAALSLGFITQALAADSLSADEQKLRDLDAQWSAAAVKKDVAATVVFYADDAVLCPPNEASVTTKDAVRKAWEELLEAPGAAIKWTSAKVEVAKSGEIGYVRGTYEQTMNNPGGEPVTERGKYVEIFKKQADGSWKCAVDIWSSDTPSASIGDEE